ncbi:hypothetical protein EDC94DRAFT_607976 [Helicostylum pulchrum]|uniref:Atos-like conserved domain-containing protein n=1 Tax=Helicostylum pulchrum TaxID=562976 RepID=A0ABP9Y4D5_9FUNG|nr:hypothetical protein EDC94DRAFT_607976 [Helicostylum pulchrum]
MPIPVNNNNVVMPTLQIVFSQIVQLVFSAKIASEERLCLFNHDSCCFGQIPLHTRTSSIVINILQKHSDILLERWIMSFDILDSSFSQDTLQFIKDVSNFIQGMPAKTNCIEMYTIATLNGQQCHSFNSQQELIEFNSQAHLKAKRFALSNFSLQVVYDENATIYYKKPLISLQSLSSPSFMSWSKMQQPITSLQDNVHPLLPPVPTSNQIPIVAVRRLSRLSLSAMELDEQDNNYSLAEEQDVSSIPIPSPRMQYTHHTSFRTSIAYSTSPPTHFYDLAQQQQQRRNSLTSDIHQRCLVGSFEESLLSGRMSSMPSKPITFHCQIGVLGLGDCKPSLKCPPHCSIVFPATFFKLGQEEEGNTPYVGTVDLSEPGYRIPPKGQLQVVVKNPNKTAVKLFLIPYDFTDMPKNTKTFLRQKSYTLDTPFKLLRYAIHLQICRTEKKRIYLYKSMRIVFANRIADAREKFQVVCEGPKSPVYVPM